MKRFKNLLVYIPQTVVDENLIHWVTTIAEKAESDRIDFVSSFQGYENIMSDDEWETFSSEVLESWSEKSPFKDADLEVNFEIFRKPGLKVVLEHMASGDYDLIVLPREHLEGLSFVERVVRKGTTGVLIIPKSCPPDFSSILLSLDFGELSKQSLDWAEAFASIAEDKPNLEALHVMQMPTQSRAMAMMDPQLIRNQIHSQSTTQLSDFIQENAKQPDEWTPIIAEHPLPSVQINNEAKQRSTKLLVIGSRGKNAISAALLGGQSIDLIRDCEIPLLVVKRKNETLGFVKQILGIS